LPNNWAEAHNEGEGKMNTEERITLIVTSGIVAIVVVIIAAFTVCDTTAMTHGYTQKTLPGTNCAHWVKE